MDMMKHAELSAQLKKLRDMVRTLDVLRRFLLSLIDDVQDKLDGGENG